MSKRRFGLERSQWWALIALFSILIITSAGGLFLYYDRVPDYLYSPTRYVFLTDKLSNRLDIVDLENREEAGAQDLDVVPDMFTVSTTAPLMAYGSYTKKRLFFYNLLKKSSVALELPSEPVNMFFIPDRQQLLVIMRHGVAIADYQQLGVYPLQNLAALPSFSVNHEPVFSTLDGSLWIPNPEKPIIYRLVVSDGNQNNQWQTYDVPLPDGEQLGPLSVNAQGNLLAFSDAQGKHGYVFSPQTGELTRLVTFASAAKPIAPFLDANSQWAVFANASNTVMAKRTNNSGEALAQPVPATPLKIRGGWLNQLWVVITTQGVGMLSAEADMPFRWFDLPGETRDLWITGDGKTALLSYRAGLQQVLPFDLQTRTQMRPIDLQGILQVNLIRMGGNNSFCY